MTWIDIVQDELRKCTNCGLCLSECPTFAEGRAEGDSPRGRVHLTAAMLNGGVNGDSIASRHLSGCIECAACHSPCPTGVRFAAARRAHRHATESLDLLGFDQRVTELADSITHDPGADLTIRSVRALLVAQAPTRKHIGPLAGGVLVLTGPMLGLAAPGPVSQLKAWLVDKGPPLARDPALSAALDRASGLLRDVGLSAEHDQAIVRVREIVEERGYRWVTIAVFDLLALRLREEPLPAALRIVPAPEVFPLSTSLKHGQVVWDDSIESPFRALDIPPGSTALPNEHHAATAPVLLAHGALASLRGLIEAKRTWLKGRTLLTSDARNLVRFDGARHIVEFVAGATDAEPGPSTWTGAT